MKFVPYVLMMLVEGSRNTPHSSMPVDMVVAFVILFKFMSIFAVTFTSGLIPAFSVKVLVVCVSTLVDVKVATFVIFFLVPPTCGQGFSHLFRFRGPSVSTFRRVCQHAPPQLEGGFPPHFDPERSAANSSPAR